VSVSFCLRPVVECSGRTAKSIVQPNRFRSCTFETYPVAPAPLTMTSVAFPKSIFSELASNLPRHACRTGESITMSSKKSWLSVGITSFNGKISLTFLFLLLALPAFAAGGACPSNTNYVNLTTGAATGGTLSSYGITSCYFIAANGSDSNNGLSEVSPWAHAPGMPSCSGSCATVASVCNSNNCKGFGFIFRGGDTWHFGNNGASPYTGGTWDWSAGTGGTLSNPIYVGVDQSWFSGGSWARPILTGDNPVCGPSNVGGNCHSGSLANYKLSQYYVSSCAYQVGSGNIMIHTSGSSHYLFDNFEIAGLCQNAVGQPGGRDEYMTYGSSGDMRFLNLYLHGWTHLQYADVNGGSGCNSGNVCFGISIFAGGKSSTPDDVLRYVVIDGSDSDPIAAQACYCDFWDVAYSYIGNQSGVITRQQHLYHDNLYEYWYENGHGNVMESVGDAPGTNATYNNLFRHVNTTHDPGDPMFWPFPPPGTTDYFFNNLSYDVTSMEYFNVGQNSNGGAQGPLVVFNNTFQNNVISGGGIFGCNTNQQFSWTAANNLYITEGSSAYSTNKCTTGGNTDTTSLLMNNATATSDGYTSSQTYVYSPTSSGSPTVGAGTNGSQAFCGALATAGLSAAATACQSDTNYACSYSSSGHTVSCPARTQNARPGNGAWDIAAYEYSTQDQQPNPPTGLSAVVQ
jgi:hypothetical protein